MRTLWQTFRQAFWTAYDQAREPAQRPARTAMALTEHQARLDHFESRLLALEAEQADYGWHHRIVH